MDMINNGVNTVSSNLTVLPNAALRFEFIVAEQRLEYFLNIMHNCTVVF